MARCLIYPNTIIYPWTIIYPNGIVCSDPGLNAWQPMQVRPRSDSVRYRPTT